MLNQIKSNQNLHQIRGMQYYKANSAIIQFMNPKGATLMSHDELTLQILRHTEQIRSQKSMADQLGYSVGKVNYILKALIAKGLVKVENFATSDNKRGYRYLLTPEGIEEKIVLTQKFVERKKREYEELQRELEKMYAKKI